MIRVLLAEDMHLVRGARVVPAVREHRPDVAVLDIGMPGADGVEPAERIAAELPGWAAFLAVAATPETLRRALAAGASGFMLKDAPATAGPAGTRTATSPASAA